MLLSYVNPDNFYGSPDHLAPIQHVFYEVAGTAGAFASSSAISAFGNNYSFFLTPVFFTFAGLTWYFISLQHHSSAGAAVGLQDVEDTKPGGYVTQLANGFASFGKSVWVGFLIIFGGRKFICGSPSCPCLRLVTTKPLDRALPRLRFGPLPPQVLGVHPRTRLRQAYSWHKRLVPDYCRRLELW